MDWSKTTSQRWRRVNVRSLNTRLFGSLRDLDATKNRDCCPRGDHPVSALMALEMLAAAQPISPA